MISVLAAAVVVESVSVVSVVEVVSSVTGSVRVMKVVATLPAELMVVMVEGMNVPLLPLPVLASVATEAVGESVFVVATAASALVLVPLASVALAPEVDCTGNVVVLVGVTVT